MIICWRKFLMSRVFCFIGIYPLLGDHIGVMDSSGLGGALINGFGCCLGL
jgi:hypothetical protein